VIIGLSGYARSGKDTAAAGMDMWGFKRVAFADKLRDFLYLLNPIIQPRYKRAFAMLVPDARVQTVIDKHGWGGYKETPYGPEIRELLQRLGTECGRTLISDTVWIDAALNNVELDDHYKSIVVTDVRFPNEAQAIKDRGGYIVRIERDGIKPANAHPSETALDDWVFDSIIDNNGTPEDLVTRLVNAALFHAL
jgi:hypothetical protein